MQWSFSLHGHTSLLEEFWGLQGQSLPEQQMCFWSPQEF